jgi:TonB family protein
VKKILRVSYVWHGEVMADRVMREPAGITLGDDADVTFVTPDLGLPPRFEAIRPGATGYLLTLGTGMGGHLRLDGKQMEVREFVRHGGGTAEGAQGAFRATAIEPGDWGVVHLDATGDHVLFFHFVDEEPVVPTSPWRDASQILPAAAFAIIAHTVLLIVVFQLKPEHSGFVFPGKRDLVAGYLVKRPEPEPPPTPAPRAGEEAAISVEPPRSTQGKEGKAGGEGEKERQRAPDPDKGEPDQTIPEQIQVGLMSRTSRDAIKKTLDRGGFDEKLGKALARMQGTLNDGTMGGHGSGSGTGFGPGAGTGTSTRGGTGSGGGGKAIGDIQTARPMDTGGTRAARGTPGGTGIKEVGVKVDTGNPAGDLGGLTAAEILKVVNSRRNALLACYNREAQRVKGLGGKVNISWKINASGQVLDARVQKSTMGNGRVEDCLVRQVSSMRFPSPKNGAVAKVNFPFIFALR